MFIASAPGVNFINIKCACFSYKRLFFQLRFGFEQTFVQKIRVFNVDEIDGSYQDFDKLTWQWSGLNSDFSQFSLFPQLLQK